MTACNTYSVADTNWLRRFAVKKLAVSAPNYALQRDVSAFGGAAAELRR